MCLSFTEPRIHVSDKGAPCLFFYVLASNQGNICFTANRTAPDLSKHSLLQWLGLPAEECYYTLHTSRITCAHSHRCWLPFPHPHPVTTSVQFVLQTVWGIRVYRTEITAPKAKLPHRFPKHYVALYLSEKLVLMCKILVMFTRVTNNNSFMGSDGFMAPCLSNTEIALVFKILQ